MVIQAAAGPEAIGDAMLEAFPGDIIELTTSGGVYTDTAQITITFDVTIRAAEGLEKKPVIIPNHGNDIFYLSSGGLTLSGIKFDGMLNGEQMGYNFIYWKASTETIESSDFSLKIDDCEFWNWGARAISCSDGTLIALDSIIVTNSVFMNGVKQGIYLKPTKQSSDIFPGSYKYCKIENCLFTGIQNMSGDGSAIRCVPGNRDVGDQGWPEVFIDHVTVDNCPIGIDLYTSSGALVTNCIVANMPDTTGEGKCYDLQGGRFTEPALPPVNTLKNSSWHNGYINLTGSSTVTAVLENVDSIAPQYTDAKGGDYSLVPGSPGTGAATDGTDIGYLGPPVDTTQTNYTMTGAEQLKYNADIRVFPNPAGESAYISLGNETLGTANLEIFDITGKLVQRMENLMGQKKIDLDLSSVPPGLYFGVLKSEGNSHSFKFIKE